jgi:hypothetical protein
MVGTAAGAGWRQRLGRETAALWQRTRLALRLGAGDRDVRRLLLGLLIVDGIFMVVHAVRWFFYQESGLLHSSLFDISADWSLAEMFNYLQTALLVALLWRLGRRRGMAVFTGWAALYFLALLDDSLQFHERGGYYLVDHYGIPSVFGLRPQDLAEVMVWLGLGVPATAAVLIGARRSAADANRLAAMMIVPFAALLFFAVGVDMVHAVVKKLGILEDGGEMVAISAACALALLLQRDEVRVRLIAEGAPAAAPAPLIAVGHS